MAKSFSEIERHNIREMLINACEESWSTYGFKKTGVDDLCRQAGISKGAFYLFYNSKEDLFCDTIERVRLRIDHILEESLTDPPNKESLCRALKQVFREYDRRRMLFGDDIGDFYAFLNKLPPEKRLRFLPDSVLSPYMAVCTPYLKLTVEREKAADIFITLFQTAHIRKPCTHDRFEVFDFLIDHVVDEIFEEVAPPPIPAYVGEFDAPERTDAL